ncbi:MAG: RnfABCDGE type electron transport complex subunit D [Lysobacteraceae bacterium]
MTGKQIATPLPAQSRSTQAMMLWTLLALLLPVAARVVVVGVQVLFSVATALVIGVLCDAVVAQLPKRSLRESLVGSSAITAVLVALCIPPATPWWLTASSIVFAIVLGKQAFGGLGRNLLNPAMLGYALVLVLFPKDIERALTLKSHSLHAGEWLAIADVCGGLLLIGLRVVRWQVPLAFCIGVLLTALAFGKGVPDIWPTLVIGNALLAAFFIASDPVTGCASARGRWLFGFGAGALLNTFGQFQGVLDPLPFAILAMNAVAPFIDHHLRSRRAGQPQHG